MKKNEQLPDFSKLCAPEQNHIILFISQQIFFFFLCAASGFLWEVFIMYLKDGYFANRGFLYGPWLPIYGAGAVLLYLILGSKELLRNKEKRSPSGFMVPIPAKKHPFRVFLLSVLFGSGLELLIGRLLDKVWHLHYWDYSYYPLNFHGYICLWSALGFGIAGVLWVCVISDFITHLWLQIPLHRRYNLNTLLILLFLIDCATSLIFPNTGKNITFP